MKIRYRALNGQNSNIDTPNAVNVKTELKTSDILYKNSPSESHLTLDSNVENSYHETKEELDEIAKNWVELLLNGILEKPQ